METSLLVGLAIGYKLASSQPLRDRPATRLTTLAYVGGFVLGVVGGYEVFDDDGAVSLCGLVTAEVAVELTRFYVASPPAWMRGRSDAAPAPTPSPISDDARPPVNITPTTTGAEASAHLARTN